MSGCVQEASDWRDFLLSVFFFVQGLTGADGSRGERGHSGNPVKQTFSLFKQNRITFPVLTFSSDLKNRNSESVVMF